MGGAEGGSLFLLKADEGFHAAMAVDAGAGILQYEAGARPGREETRHCHAYPDADRIDHIKSGAKRMNDFAVSVVSRVLIRS
jgi:hypothetical protein